MDAIYRGFELLGFRRREDFGPGGPFRGLSSPASLPIGKAFWADFSHFPMFHLKIPNSNKKFLKIPKSKSDFDRALPPGTSCYRPIAESS